jgi:hypothetical protein
MTNFVGGGLRLREHQWNSKTRYRDYPHFQDLLWMVKGHTDNIILLNNLFTGNVVVR